jgi:hypothetical protein
MALPPAGAEPPFRCPPLYKIELRKKPLSLYGLGFLYLGGGGCGHVTYRIAYRMVGGNYLLVGALSFVWRVQGPIEFEGRAP